MKDLKKGKEKGGKEENKEKSDKTHVKMKLKYPPKIHKNREEFFWLARLYTPVLMFGRICT